MTKPLPRSLTGGEYLTSSGRLTQPSANLRPLKFDPGEVSAQLRDAWPDIKMDPEGYRHYAVMPHDDLAALIEAHKGIYLPPMHDILYWRLRDPTLRAADISPRLERERWLRDFKDIVQKLLLILFGAMIWAVFGQ